MATPYDRADNQKRAVDTAKASMRIITAYGKEAALTIRINLCPPCRSAQQSPGDRTIAASKRTLYDRKKALGISAI